MVGSSLLDLSGDCCVTVPEIVRFFCTAVTLGAPTRPVENLVGRVARLDSIDPLLERLESPLLISETSPHTNPRNQSLVVVVSIHLRDLSIRARFMYSSPVAPSASRYCIALCVLDRELAS